MSISKSECNSLCYGSDMMSCGSLNLEPQSLQNQSLVVTNTAVSNPPIIDYAFDIALYRDKIGQGINQTQILKLYENVFKPDKYYNFPKNSKGRSFLLKWLERFSWLAYSPSQNGVYCICCCLFGDNFPSKKGKVSYLFLIGSMLHLSLANMKAHTNLRNVLLMVFISQHLKHSVN